MRLALRKDYVERDAQLPSPCDAPDVDYAHYQDSGYVAPRTMRGYTPMKGLTSRAGRDSGAFVFDLRKACCFGSFFNDEPNVRIAENAFECAQLAQDPDIFLGGYGERTEAIGAGDDVILPIARDPDRRSVPLDCRARRSLAE